jgi:hypothetical protein
MREHHDIAQRKDGICRLIIWHLAFLILGKRARDPDLAAIPLALSGSEGLNLGHPAGKFKHIRGAILNATCTAMKTGTRQDLPSPPGITAKYGHLRGVGTA